MTVPKLTAAVNNPSYYDQDPSYSLIFAVEAAHTAPLLDKPLPCHLFTTNDVVFLFPYEKPEKQRYLWASVEDLCKVSPAYFGTMFNAGMEESECHLASMSELASAWKTDLEKVLEAHREKGTELENMPDSDVDEEEEEKPASQAGSKQENKSIRYVVIRNTPFKTYKAVFEWLYTGKIPFAKLSSSSSATASRVDKNLVSPKSIYRLSHRLELPALQKLALANFKSQHNVLQELFSDPCYIYEELRQVALDVALEQWPAIAAEGGITSVMKIVEKGETDAQKAAETALVLLEMVGKPK